MEFDILKANKKSPHAFKLGALGFSLIEISVLLSILIVLSTIFITSQERARWSNSIRLASESTQSVLRQMQNNTLSGERYSLTTAARAYGVKLTNNGNAYEAFVEEAVTTAYKSLETHSFLNGTVLNTLRVTSGGVTQDATYVEVRFFPPFGDIRVTAKNGETTLFTEQKNVIVIFRLTATAVSQYRQLTVDGLSGRISEF